MHRMHRHKKHVDERQQRGESSRENGNLHHSGDGKSSKPKHRYGRGIHQSRADMRVQRVDGNDEDYGFEGSPENQSDMSCGTS